ncbi:isochorismate synthase [Thioalkalicoccus limnaeus]|uniref:isochorismate synthase n=1 Tax=Thioalkalicoccus limnaeus TaxID=120681 RepID=A0ABV4BCE4_9GAMM
MLAPTETHEYLKQRLAETIGLLPLDDDQGLVSLILELPDFPRLAPTLAGPQFQFAHGDHRTLHAGYGVAAEWQAMGPMRFHQLRATAQAARASWTQLDVDDTGHRGFALLGFAASPMELETDERDHLPNALLWVPEVALRGHHDRGALILTTTLPASAAALLARWQGWIERLVPALRQVEPTADPGPIRLRRDQNQPEIVGWEHLVESALKQIAEGKLDKVVISRRLRVTGARPFDRARLMTTLGRLFPSCQLVSISRNETHFVAATPERLVACSGDRIEVDAIAGTVARAAHPHRDAALGEALLNSVKDRREHDLVIDAIRAALTTCSDQIEIPEVPVLMRLKNAQHLWSPIRARVAPGMDVFRLAELLHPTPATNGEPRNAASSWLRRTEPINRGWYTGAAGIVEPDLTGDLWVMLRCAQICRDRADLFAGAGIVAGSDPLCEWQETEDKLGAMLTALQFA